MTSFGVILATCFWTMVLLAPSASPFLSPILPTGSQRLFAVAKNNHNNHNMDHLLDTTSVAADETTASSTTWSSRRDWIQKSIAAITATSVATFASTTTSAFADDSSSPKILLLGGTGLVGSQIRKILNEQGISVVATSRNGRDDTVAFDVTKVDNVATQVESLAKGCTAVISTVGVLGTPDDTLINAANALAAAGAKSAGVSRFVYITVSPEVKDMAQNIEFLQPYMEGKTFARDAVINTFGSDNKLSFTLIEPTFIYGGDQFQINPPRVTGLYGSFIEGALSSAPLRLAANLMPAGFLKVALEPPVSAEAVAKAAIAGALGKTTTTTNSAYLDTYDKIQAAANLI